MTRFFPWIAVGLVGLVGAGAAGHWPGRETVLLALLLLLPLGDRRWQPPALPRGWRHYAAWTALATGMAAIAVFMPSQRAYLIETLIFAALPEEWFFRGWLLDRLGRNTRANVVVSVLFAVLHGLARNWTNAALVFVPSLFFGWLYLRTRDLPLVVLVHALGNTVVAVAIAAW